MNPARQFAAVRRQFAGELLSVSSPVRQRVYIRANWRTTQTHTPRGQTARHQSRHLFLTTRPKGIDQMTDMTAAPTPPPIHWVTDQARAWRAVAAILEHDGALFQTVVTEAREDGPDAVDKLIAALARNLVLQVRMSIGMDALDELVTAELTAAAEYQDPAEVEYHDPEETDG
jgi:hypothetical protein